MSAADEYGTVTIPGGTGEVVLIGPLVDDLSRFRPEGWFWLNEPRG